MPVPKQKPNRSRGDFATPEDLIDAARRMLGIGHFCWDLAADDDNTKGYYWLTEADDALTRDWYSLPAPPNAEHVWCWLNPPFGDIAPWAERCALFRRKHIALLVPASVGSNWYADFVHPFATVLVLQGRPSFDGVGPYPKDCILALYGPGFRPGLHLWDWRHQE